MNKDIKDRWLKALRSGEFTQTKSQLRDKTGHCCLGVLCELHSRETGVQWSEDNRYMGLKIVMPPAVVIWAQLTDFCPLIFRNEFQDYRSLGTINDEGKTFEQIADIIEKQL